MQRPEIEVHSRVGEKRVGGNFNIGHKSETISSSIKRNNIR